MLRETKHVNRDVFCGSVLRSIYEAHTIWRLAFCTAKKGSGLAAGRRCLSWATKAPRAVGWVVIWPSPDGGLFQYRVPAGDADAGQWTGSVALGLLALQPGHSP